MVEPGRLADKDRGLWTLRREFESPPGYHSHAFVYVWGLMGGGVFFIIIGCWEAILGMGGFFLMGFFLWLGVPG